MLKDYVESRDFFIFYINIKMRSLLTSLLLVILSMFGIGYLQNALLNEKSRSLTHQKAQEQLKSEELLINAVAKVPSFGFNNLIADWIYLKFVQYYGDRARETTGYNLASVYFQAFVDKDPKFIKPYFLFSPATTLFAGRPDKTIEIMNQGLKSIVPQLPESYQVWYYKGIDELLFSENAKDAERSYRMVVNWSKYHDTTESRNAAKLASQTVQFLQQNPNSRRAKAAAWMGIFANTQDDRVKQVALLNIKRLGGKIHIKPGSVSISFPDDD